MNAQDALAAARSSAVPFTILGGSGFIGSHLAVELDRQGIPHPCPARGDESIFTRPLGHVIYAIGMTADYARRPFETFEAHVGFLARVLSTARFDSLVYLSSTRLYDGLTSRVTETSSVFSEELDGTNYLHTIVRAAASAVSSHGVVLDTAPHLARDYVDVVDVANALVAIALFGRRPIYNVASGENVTNAQILEQLGRLGGGGVTLSRPAAVDTSPEISIDALVADFGLRPRRLGEWLPGLLDRAKHEAAHGA
jgi:hypothetical protein